MFVTITGTLTPASVSTGAAAAGTACLRSIRRFEIPFESAVRTNSSCRTSRIELFIIRSHTAASGRPLAQQPRTGRRVVLPRVAQLEAQERVGEVVAELLERRAMVVREGLGA